jgi:hypothetical protein
LHPCFAWGKFGSKTIPGDFDLFDFGKGLVQRALQLDPKSTWAHQLLNVRKAASAYLLKAAEAPVTEALKYPIVNARPWPMNRHFPSVLAAALLKAGQRDAVVEFLESYSRITVAGRDRWLEDIALIRQGKLPSWAKG